MYHPGAKNAIHSGIERAGYMETNRVKFTFITTVGKNSRASDKHCTWFSETIQKNWVSYPHLPVIFCLLLSVV